MPRAMSLKCPVTVTVTELAADFVQDGVQVSATSAGATDTNDPLASLTARQTTRLFWRHALPAE